MKVLISGAGIAGPTLAYWLARTGAEITVLEKAKSLLSQGQNIDVTCTARKVIAKMGLKEEVLRHNTTEGGSKFYDQHGKAFAPFPVLKGATNVGLRMSKYNSPTESLVTYAEPDFRMGDPTRRSGDNTL